MAEKTKKNRQDRSDPENIVYLVQRRGQPDFQIELPAHWKVTFGAVNPGGQSHHNDLHCLRVWEGEKLRAVFCDVRGFRDLSLSFARKIEVETGNSSWVRDDAGNYEANEKRQLESRFESEQIPF
jgi:hypothetical protein